jgi:hypothetical protein
VKTSRLATCFPMEGNVLYLLVCSVHHLTPLRLLVPALLPPPMNLYHANCCRPRGVSPAADPAQRRARHQKRCHFVQNMSRHGPPLPRWQAIHMEQRDRLHPRCTAAVDGTDIVWHCAALRLHERQRRLPKSRTRTRTLSFRHRSWPNRRRRSPPRQTAAQPPVAPAVPSLLTAASCVSAGSLSPHNSLILCQTPIEPPE